MSDESLVATEIEALIRSLLPTLGGHMAGPATIQVSSFKHGRGVGMINGNIVDIEAHPLQALLPGDVAVGVPTGPSKFFVVGKKT